MSELSEEVIQQVLNSDWLKIRDTNMKSVGWKYRNSNTGTYYEVGWDETNDEGEEIWFCDHKTNSFEQARSTANRWGCDYITIRANPYITKEEK